MKARRTAAIQISECGASELDAVEDILCEVGSCRPVIDDEFVMTDLGEIRKVLDQFGDTKMTTALPDRLTNTSSSVGVSACTSSQPACSIAA